MHSLPNKSPYKNRFCPSERTVYLCINPSILLFPGEIVSKQASERASEKERGKEKGQLLAIKISIDDREGHEKT